MTSKVTIATVLAIWITYGVGGNVSIRSQFGYPSHGDAWVDILLTGKDQKLQDALYHRLREEMPFTASGVIIQSRSFSLPLFRIGYIRLSFDQERGLDQVKVDRIIEREFPGLRPDVRTSTT